MQEIYGDFLKYNLWANTLIAERAMLLTDLQFEQPIRSSFPSVRATLLHIWDAEVIWHKRLQGESLNTFPSRHFVGGRQAVIKGLTDHSRQFMDFIHQQAPAWFGSTIHYDTTSGKAFYQPAWQILHHCMNHSTYHRGQVITLLRQLGMETVPQTDYIHYLRVG
ncbi:MAG: DinB family protein [Phaeodactylibacter sp.]|nr:DinB family protein [Phaeodactylibacter sp.]